MRFWESSNGDTLLNGSEPTRRTQNRWHPVIGQMALGNINDALQPANSGMAYWLTTPPLLTLSLAGSEQTAPEQVAVWGRGIFCWCEGTTPCQSFLGWASQTWTLSLSFRVLIQQAVSSRAAEGQYTHTHTHTHTGDSSVCSTVGSVRKRSHQAGLVYLHWSACFPVIG